MAQTSFQSIAYVPFDSLKTEKLGPEEHEFEISKWLKLENEPMAGLGGSNYSTASDLISNSDALFSAATIHQMPEFYSTSPTLTIQSSNNVTSGPIPSSQTSQPANQTTFSTQFQFPVYQTVPFNNTYQTIQYQPNQYTAIPYNTFPAQYNQAYPQYTTQYIPAQFPANQQQPFTTSIIPAQVLAFSGSTPNANGTFQQTQYHPSPVQYMIYQPAVQPASAPKPQAETESSEDRKRKHSAVKPFPRRVRQTRPKVVEAKGAVQCKGRNRKKGTQCRNAALMEYIGPRPIYCAEHIELDAKSLYEKCKSSYQKEPGDNKGCKEVVLKEFGTCYKHFSDLLAEMLEKDECDEILKFHNRISDLLNQLERDAASAKKKDGDLYQRKNKLIPKFQEMKKLIATAVETLESRGKSFGSLPRELLHVSSPIDSCIDGPSSDILDVFTSSEDEDILSSPASSSLEEEFDQILN